MTRNLDDLRTDPSAQYLGDGVYATFDGYQIWLHTSDGLRILSSIALEIGTYSNLTDFARRQWAPVLGSTGG